MQEAKAKKTGLYKMGKNKILPSVAIAVIVLIAVSIVQHHRETDAIDPCQLGGSKKIKIIYILSNDSVKKSRSAGCSSCDSGNQDQWKIFHKFYGGRDEIEFIVLFPDEKTKQKRSDLPYDTGLIIEKGIKTNGDEFIICKREQKVLKQRGRIDMNSIRKANAILSMAHLDKSI